VPRVGFYPTFLVFERPKTINALDRAATVNRNYSLNDDDDDDDNNDDDDDDDDDDNNKLVPVL